MTFDLNELVHEYDDKIKSLELEIIKLQAELTGTKQARQTLIDAINEVEKMANDDTYDNLETHRKLGE